MANERSVSSEHPRKPNKAAPFPTREEILQFVHDSPTRVGKREIARAFQLDAEQKKELKKVLRGLEQEGALGREKRRYSDPGSLPEVSVVVVTGIDRDGDVIAEPIDWRGPGDPPIVRMLPERSREGALGRGDKVLARLTRNAEGGYDARVVRRLASAPKRILGIYESAGTEGRIRPADRRLKDDILVDPRDVGDAKPGDMVLAESLPGRRLGPRHARIVERLGPADGPNVVSLISIVENDIPTEFPPAAIKEAKATGPAPLDAREDLRQVPLVTIDGADARDFDDAVWAEPDTDPQNPGGWHLLVAIADVAWYVRPGSALDEAAYERGNSVYFPDRVVPMLPEELSNGWCSLKPDEDRPCLAVHMWVGKDGRIRKHRFVRGLMRSAARLTYEQVQAAADGNPDAAPAPLVENVIRPLYGAYRMLMDSRAERGVLELDLPERRVIVGKDGSVVRVETRQRLDSHKLIEEFMIAANVAAAETLEDLRQPTMYRIHDEPGRDKLDALREFLGTIGLKLAKGQVIRPGHFNQILAKAAGTRHQQMVNEVVLRSQSQAEYAPDNIGHFGLALVRYCHFTSPIRRYSDLMVHRALIRGLKLGEGGLEDDHRDFVRVGRHLSETERRAATAERAAVDRFTAQYLADRVGATFKGRVNGVQRFGLFVTLDDSGGDGLIPVSTLPEDFYIYEETRHRLKGRRSGREFRLGDAVTVELLEADRLTGSMVLALVEDGQRVVGRRPETGRGPAFGKNRGGRRPKR